MSREKQIEEIKDCIDSVYGCDCAYYGVDGLAIADALCNAGYRKQSEGEWELQRQEHGGYTRKCSECGYNVMPYRAESMKYCPHCGAKMKGNTGENE